MYPSQHQVDDFREKLDAVERERDMTRQNIADDVREAKPMTTEEARDAVQRFIHSHFGHTERERARITIPANPQRDDDIRLMAHIERTGAELAGLYVQRDHWMDIALGQERELTRLRSENARLRGIVSKLPLTADGVAVVPGMDVWKSDGAIRGPLLTVVAIDDYRSYDAGWSNTYSTREAAIAAK
jgi:hypothetical protein